METTNISKNLFDFLAAKVVKINKKSTLQPLKDIEDLQNLQVVLGVYNISNETGTFTVFKIFVESDAMVKGSFKCWNIISNALLAKNKDKKVAPKINIYNQNDNNKFYNTIIQFVKNKNVNDIQPGEYILQGLKLGDLLEIEI